MRKWNQSYGTSTGRYALHGKRGKRGKEREIANEKCPEMTVDGHNLTRCGGCQGYMDFFSEVFCVVRFFFFTFFAHQETPRWKTFSKTEREHNHLMLHFWMQLVKPATFLNFGIQEGNIQVCKIDLQRTNTVDLFKWALREPPLLRVIYIYNLCGL